MNSFRFVERGDRPPGRPPARRCSVRGEPRRAGDAPLDPVSGLAHSARSKEDAHDYRYFPEPDLVPVVVGEEMLAAARAELPELPAARAERYETALGIESARARLLAFRGELERLLRTRWPPRPPLPRAVATWVELLAAKLPDGDPGADRGGHSRRPWRRSPRWPRPGPSPRAPRARCSTGSWPTAATPRRSSRPRGSARSAGRTRSGPSCRPRSPPTPTPPRRSAAGT